MHRRVIPLLLTLCLLPIPVSAEVIYLKNGSRYEGKILKQTKETINLQLPFEYSEVIELPKSTIAIHQPPSAAGALALGLAFPGGGQLYLGNIPDGLLFFALSSFAASAGYGIGSALAPSGYTALGQGIGAGLWASIPWISGALEARRIAAQEEKEEHLKIDYSR